jgi:hypothetical protein
MDNVVMASSQIPVRPINSKEKKVNKEMRHPATFQANRARKRIITIPGTHNKRLSIPFKVSSIGILIAWKTSLKLATS